MTGIGAWLAGLNLASRLLGGALLASVLFNLVSCGVGKWEMSDMTAQRDAAQERERKLIGNNERVEAGIAGLKISVDNARTDIKNLADASDTASKRAAAVQETVRKNVQRIEVNTAKLLASPRTAPLGSLEACQAGTGVLWDVLP